MFRKWLMDIGRAMCTAIGTVTCKQILFFFRFIFLLLFLSFFLGWPLRDLVYLFKAVLRTPPQFTCTLLTQHCKLTGEHGSKRNLCGEVTVAESRPICMSALQLFRSEPLPLGANRIHFMTGSISTDWLSIMTIFSCPSIITIFSCGLLVLW